LIARIINRWKQYTLEDKEYIRLHDDGTEQTRQRIAEKLGRTMHGIRHMCGRIGVQRWRTDDWEQWEDDYLREHIGRMCCQDMAKCLHRGRGKLQSRIIYLRLGRNHRDGWFDTNDVAFGLGCSHTHVLDLINRGKLKAKQGGKGKIWVVKKEAIYNYLTTYPMELDGKNCDMVFIVDILTDGDIKYTTGADRCRMG
jgi:hypothetical protein